MRKLILAVALLASFTASAASLEELDALILKEQAKFEAMFAEMEKRYEDLREENYKEFAELIKMDESQDTSDLLDANEIEADALHKGWTKEFDAIAKEERKVMDALHEEYAKARKKEDKRELWSCDNGEIKLLGGGVVAFGKTSPAYTYKDGINMVWIFTNNRDQQIHLLPNGMARYYDFAGKESAKSKYTFRCSKTPR